MVFKTSFDGFTKAATIGVLLLFGTMEFFFFFERENYVAFGFLLFAIALILGCWLFHPVKYIVTDRQVIIERPISNVNIERVIIHSVKEIGSEDLKWSVRAFGVGGLFGYFGTFVNSKIGLMTWYATRRNKTVLIKTIGNKKIVVTPDAPNEFVAQLSKPELTTC